MDDSERDLLLTQATSAHQGGDFPRAEANYRQLWDEHQDDNLGYLLGTLLLQKGDAEQAIDFLAPIAARNLQSADLQNNLGVAFQLVKNHQQALLAFQATIRADKDYPQVYHNIGKLLVEAENPLEAEKCYCKAVELMPEDSTCRGEWVDVLITLKKWEDVARELNILLERIPDNIEYRTNFVFALAKLHRYEEAIKQCQKILLAKPNAVEILSNLSYLYEHTGCTEQAIETARQASQLAPESAEVANNLGIALRSAHQVEPSIAEFSRAIQLSPTLQLAQFNLGSTQLLDQQYPAGWEHYESRRELIGQHSEIESISNWQGDAISGKKLLVVCDRGFGDAIQLCRFLPRIRQASQAEIILQTPPELIDLFKQSSYQGNPLADQLISETDPLPEVDYYFSLTSAGKQFQLTLDDAQMDAPYLQADANDASNVTENQTKTIGLCWRGNANQAQDHVRTMQLSALHNLAKIEGINWVAIQLDATTEELASWPGEIEDRGTKLQSFTDTSRELEQIDLLITVDTSIAHLAGAMGKPTLTLLAHTPDWRWHLNRTDSPWYPSMKLIRQPTWGDWDAVVAQVEAELTVE
ncbi:MAG: tetratricopeptide repeat protein [Planctomycetaceae bacterium]|nr:tetratricopeptide repeat protein [Planctomycetaceae bacterium]